MRTQNLREYEDEVQEKIDYWFNNEALLLQAFTRSSYSAQYGGENNEVLEFIGDKALDFYVIKAMADRFGFMKSESSYYDAEYDNDEFCIVAHKNESNFTDIKKSIVNNKTLAARIDDLEFAKYMYLGDSDIANNVINQEKVKADLFEAIIGAIAIDSGWNPEEIQNSVEYMLKIDDFLDDVDVEEERPEKFKIENAINTLKELAEKGVCSTPNYTQSDEMVEVGDGKMAWTCTCTVRSWGIQMSTYGPSKKAAKKYAAYLVLCEHYDLPDEYEREEE
ncbi:MAG: hypothetical protein MJZ34_14790 [Paludibacteraceae bacterium]|nr:hypothetical protein [Paludibacteraceae bacterium]